MGACREPAVLSDQLVLCTGTAPSVVLYENPNGRGQVVYGHGIRLP